MVDRVVLNAIVGEARRRRIVFNIVFAAFFSAKDAVSCRASGHRLSNPISLHKQSAQSASQCAGIIDSRYSLCERANA
jgi:hypothetical protein